MSGRISAEEMNRMRGGASPQMGYDVPTNNPKKRLSAEEMKALRETAAVQEPSMWETLTRSAVQGVTFNFGDEISGGVNAALDSVLPEQMRLSNKDSFSERYSDIRDRERQANKEAEEANPKTYFAGEVVGGLAAPLGVGKAGVAAYEAGKLGGLGIKQGLKQGAKAGAAQGAITGFGSGEGITNSLLQSGQGAALGGAIGGAAGTVPGVIRGGKQLVGKLREEGADVAQTFSGGFRDAAQESAQAPLNIAGVDSVKNTVQGFRGGVQALRQRGEFAEDLAKLKDRVALENLGKAADGEISGARVASGKVLGGEGPPPIGEDLIGTELFMPGKSSLKDYVANKAATYAPGNISQDAATQALEMGASRRNLAREFDNRVAAKDIVGDVNELAGMFKKGKGSAYETLQNEARQGFQHSMADTVVPTLKQLSEDAASIPGVSGNASKILEQVDAIIMKGAGPKQWGFTQGRGFGVTEPAEAFDRLQKARQLLDSQAKFQRKNGLDVEADLLTQARDAIDEALKKAPGKSMADEVYRQGKGLRDEFFGVTEFKNPATKRPEVDEFKIAKVFGNNDTAGRFKNTIEKMREYLTTHGEKLGPETQTRMQQLLDRFDKLQSTAADKRLLEALRANPSKTSASIERANSLLNKQGLSAEALRSPASFLNAGDQFMKEFSQGLFNKPYEDLTRSQQGKLVKMFMWRNSNRNATKQQETEAFRKIMEGAL